MIGWMGRRLLTALAVRDNVVHGTDLHVGWGSIVWAPRRLEIGNDVYVGKNVTIQVDGVIGDSVLFGNCVGVVGRRDHNIAEVGIPIRSSRWVGDHPGELSDLTRIGSDVWVGYGSTVLSGIRVGNSAIIGAGSVVTRDVADNAVVLGVPAREVRKRFHDAEFGRHWSSLADRGVKWID